MKTLCLDTNILLRYLLDDDQDQSSRARQLIDETPGFRFLLTDPVLCEITWVLERPRYGFSKEDVITALYGLLAHRRFIVQDRHRVQLALDDYCRGPAGFADYLILQIGKGLGAEKLITFDQKLLAEPHCREP